MVRGVITNTNQKEQSHAPSHDRHPHLAGRQPRCGPPGSGRRAKRPEPGPPLHPIAINLALDGDDIVVAPGTYFESLNLGGNVITLRKTNGAPLVVPESRILVRRPPGRNTRKDLS